MKVIVPRYLLRKSFLMETIIFVVAFSALFLSLYKPYSDTFWLSLRSPERLRYSFLFYSLSVIILALSKRVMMLVQTHKAVVIGRFYVVTVILEWLALSALYVFMTVTIVTPELSVSWLLCLRALFCLGTILAIPYTICFLFAAYKDKEEELAAMKANVAYTRITTQFEELQPEFIDFRDSNDSLKLTLDKKSIYYIESQDNYVNICYELDEKMESYLLRCKTKVVEEQLRDKGMVRCHRSYLVNPEHIKKVTSASGGRAIISFDHEKAKDVPVSKTYAPGFRPSAQR